MIKVPENVTVGIQGNAVSVEGPKGKLQREFPDMDISIESKDGAITVKALSKRVSNTIEAHIRNMVKGVTDGYVMKMQVVYSHFPITVEVKGNMINIKNFQGEKKPRRAKVVGGAKVEVKGQELSITGTNKEEVGQTASNLRIATRIVNRDSRVFQDGIYPSDD